MIKQKLQKISLVFFTAFITMGLFFSAHFLMAAWEGPSSPPPDGNVNPPIFNESTIPSVKTQINAGAGQEALRLKSDANTSPLNIQSSAGADIFRVNQKGDIKNSPTISKDDNGNVIIQLGN